MHGKTNWKLVNGLKKLQEYGRAEVIYNKALCYRRSDVSYAIKERMEKGKSIRVKAIQDFYNNVIEYEKTGNETYRDKATGRYYHQIMWRKIAASIAEGNWYDDIDDLKLSIIKENKLPMPKYNACYACSCLTCGHCPLELFRCGYGDAPYSLFVKAYRKREKDTAITYATMIMNAWVPFDVSDYPREIMP